MGRPARVELQLEKYDIIDEIGQGGMSVVYRGVDPSLQRTVAIKVMHRHLARDPEARERFAREARAVARLTHHNIPEIYDFSSDDSEAHYLVTELVEGASLAELLESHAILPEVGVMVALGVAAALQHAHDNDIVHRDVKPENILVGLDGVVKLTDFGIAQFIGLESMTITGTLVGSPAHMSPEQIEGVRDLDARADVWALGTVLFVCATGELPFLAGTPHGVLKRIMDGAYTDPRRLNPHVDSELRRIIRRCMTVERSERYPSMTGVYVDLKAWLDQRELQDPEVEIERWVKAPGSYIEDLSKRLVATLMARADDDLANKQRHRALEALNRVLTLDPNNDQAFDRVRRLNSGMRWRRVGIWAGLAAAVTLAVVGAWSWWPETPQPVPLPVRSAAPPARLPAIERPSLAVSYKDTGRIAGQALADGAFFAAREEGAQQAALLAEAGRGAGQALAELGPRATALSVRRPPRKTSTPRAVASAPTKRDVVFSAGPPAVSAFVDGAKIPNRTTLSLSVGMHRYEIRHPSCKVKGSPCPPTRGQFLVRAGTGVAKISKQFRFPPMTVLVRCKGGTVYRGSQRVGRCGVRHRLPGKLGLLATFSVKYPSGKVVRSGKKSVAPGATVEWTVDD